MRGILSILQYMFKSISWLGSFTLGMIALIFIISVFAAPSGKKPLAIDDGSVLVLDPRGKVVELTQLPDPADYLFEEYRTPPVEVSVHDILSTLKTATNDDRIDALVINTDGFGGAFPAQLHDIAEAVRAFKAADKTVYAIGTAFEQSDYLIAAEADKIILNPAGSMLITGYSRYSNYYKGLLDKLEANVNIFRVGKFKSAVEPFARNDMSEAAKEANRTYLNGLWAAYTDSVSKARKFEAGAIDTMMNEIPQRLRKAGGDFAEFALQEGLVDALMSRNEWKAELADLYGKADNPYGFKHIGWKEYQRATDKPQTGKQIAVITAQGPIVMGEADVSKAAAESLVRYIRAARLNDEVAAIVLRVNSPGGSAFASELIRQELLTAQADGKPVVASFGGVAASGGYWISATADEIWASPTTITGSIGIFGILPTFEKTLAKVGIYNDGVGTSPIASGFALDRPLNDEAKEIIQLSIENGYRQFISLVAGGRNMDEAAVQEVAQGRVWTGQQALDHGLVDNLGNFEDAVAAAARLANIEDYRTVFYREQLSEIDQLLLEMFNVGLDVSVPLTPSVTKSVLPSANLMQEFMAVKSDIEQLTQHADPNGHMVLCLDCNIRK